MSKTYKKRNRVGGNFFGGVLPHLDVVSLVSGVCLEPDKVRPGLELNVSLSMGRVGGILIWKGCVFIEKNCSCDEESKKKFPH